MKHNLKNRPKTRGANDMTKRELIGECIKYNQWFSNFEIELRVWLTSESILFPEWKDKMEAQKIIIREILGE